jgi:hypothetical protein
VGPDGQPRKLHIAESLRAINWSAGPVEPVRPQPLSDLPAGVQGERLVDCPYFRMDRYRFGGSFAMPHTGELSIWLVLSGAAELHSVETGYRRKFDLGGTVLMPAAARGCVWQGVAAGTLLLGIRSAAQ